jgi:hypothetical protein
MRVRQVLLVILAFLLPALGKGVEVAAPAQGFLQKYCVDCHGQKVQEGDLRLDPLPADFAVPATAETWGKVFAKLERREMPPDKKPQPADRERQVVLDWIGGELRQAAKARQFAEGRVAMRRLNRLEYQNTIHDLLGIETNVMELLPEDGLAHGFDKVSSALTLSPVQIEKYLEAADLALDAALGEGPQPKYVQQRFPASELIASWARDSVRVLDADAVVFFNSGYSPTELRRFRAPAPGRYQVRVSASGFQTNGKPATLRLYCGTFGVGGKTRLLGHFEVAAETPTVIEVVERFDARNDTLKVVPYGTIPWQNKAATYDGPGLSVQWVEIEGPLEAKVWPPATRRRLLGDADGEHGTEQDAEQIMLKFAAAAFRRPVTADEVKPYLDLVRERLHDQMRFVDALRVGLKAMLVSPRFLMLEEQPGLLDGYSLAARLSYFLWSTMPDAELLAAASSGSLRRPAEITEQVDRLLNHPKARAFTEDFTGQWLGLRNIEFTTPDARLYPEFDEWLQVSMLRETHAFFEELLRTDLSLMNFIDSDFAMLNERLARHYGIRDVNGLDIRRVALQPQWHRGGVLTHASVLKVTANGTTTSPVIRGSWLADRILGRPVPPPPNNVPAIEPDIRGTKAIRDQLARHREVASCASCHARMDPLGFALENYDVIGGWRDRYRISPERGQRAEFTTLLVNHREMRVAFGPNVDAADVLPDGRQFRDLTELKQLLLAEPEAITRGLAAKLIVYATGDSVKPTDAPVLGEIVRNVAAKGYGFRSLIHEIVLSEPFLNK